MKIIRCDFGWICRVRFLEILILDPRFEKFEGDLGKKTMRFEKRKVRRSCGVNLKGIGVV